MRRVYSEARNTREESQRECSKIDDPARWSDPPGTPCELVVKRGKRAILRSRRIGAMEGREPTLNCDKKGIKDQQHGDGMNQS